MAITSYFSGTDTINQSNLNKKLVGIVGKGICVGGQASATGSNNNVTVAPYVAVTSYGMVVANDAASVVAVSAAPATSQQYIYIKVTYNSGSAATVVLEARTTTPTDTDTVSYICVCSLTTYASGFVSNSNITYSGTVSRDQITPVSDSKYLGYFQTKALRDAAYPNNVPGTVSVARLGDMTTYGTTASGFVLSFWDGSIWQDQTNAVQIKSVLDAHTGNYNLHTTADQHAALEGAGQTAPSAINRYVLEDNQGILDVDKYQGIRDAIGGPLSQANPAIAKALVIAVPRVFQVAVNLTTDTVFLDASVLGRADFVVYLGKQGNSGQSSAVQYFAIEDDYGNGYVSTVSGFPVYVTDVLDSTGTNQINPGDDAQVDSRGFYDVEANNGIYLKLSTSVAVGTRLYVRMNLLGDMSALTPNWPSNGTTFLPAITAYRNGKASYVAALQGDFATLVVGTSRAGTIPNLLVSTTLAAPGTPPSVNMYFNEGSTPKASLSVQTTVSAGTAAGTMTIWTPSLHINYDSGNSLGVVIDSAGVKSLQGLHAVNGSGTVLGSITSTGRVMATQGTAAAPGFYFAGELDAGSNPSTATGLYYKPSYTTPNSTAYGFDVYNGIGVSVLGKTALFIGRTNDNAPITDMDCPLMVLQDYEATLNTVSYFIGIDNETGVTADPVAGRIAFGVWSGLGPFTYGLDINIKDKILLTSYQLRAVDGQILGKNKDTAVDEAAPAFAFMNSAGTGMFYVDGWPDQTTTYVNGIGFSINSKAAFIITQDQDSSTQPITGTVMNPLILNRRNNGISMSYDFAIADVELGDLVPGQFRFGSIGYTGAYSPKLIIDNAVNRVDVLVRSRFSDQVQVESNVNITGTQILFADIGLGVSTTGTKLVVGKQSGPYLEVSNDSMNLKLYGTTSVRGDGNYGILYVSGAAGNISTSASIQTFNSGMLIGYGTEPSNTDKIFWGSAQPVSYAPVAYLTTSGKVYAAQVSGPSYGFAGANPSLGMGLDSGQLRLYGGGLPILIDGQVAFETAYVGGNFQVYGTLTANAVGVTTSVTAASVVVSGNVTATNGVFSGTLSGPTITALDNSTSTNAANIAKLQNVVHDRGSSLAVTGAPSGNQFVLLTIAITPGKWEISGYTYMNTGATTITANTRCVAQSYMRIVGSGPAGTNPDLTSFPNVGVGSYYNNAVGGAAMSTTNSPIVYNTTENTFIDFYVVVASPSTTSWDIYGGIVAKQIL